MPALLIPDVSEYQTVDFSVFSGPIIVRAHNGTRADRRWPQHAAGAARQPWWAAYQYLPATIDPAGAARAFLSTLGGWRPACTILDLEEGDGDQQARQHAWLTVMASDPAQDWTYSGDYFARTHGLRVDWVAAYQAREPTAAHRLWQFTDKHPFPGIGPCDGSVFHGSVADLVALTSGTPAPTPVPHPEEGDMTPAIVTTSDGRNLIYVVGDDQAAYEHSDAHGWRGIGGKWTSGLAADIDNTDKVTLFGRGTDGQLWGLPIDAKGTAGKAFPVGGHIYPPAA